ncbi:MAG: tRNA 2-thiouridine(34) synthase MnmA [Candidatus Omnitrophica bacterium]|nr:tRNA 2-thiouridine(34) synthase MnmA [Candidatus Omnitrophota bacterium]
MNSNRKKILVAMSGGVDSSVAASILLNEGHDVAGATMRTWASDRCASKNTKACCGITGVEDAREVADRLGIRYWVLNFEKEFKRHVVDPFASEYLKGRTPNPCISCNEHIKFRLFLTRAREMGYDFIATGHYAELHLDQGRNSYFISEGVDPGKDQTYVLFPLDQEVLSHLFLPLGKYSKKEIRKMAESLKLPVWNKPDSQEICFIPNHDHGEFLKKEYLNEESEPGVIRNREGKILGRHEGYFHYTRGQRRGLGVSHSERLYVVDTHPAQNEVIVGAKEDVLNRSCLVTKINWFLKPEREGPFYAEVKIRSQHKKSRALIQRRDDQSADIEFSDPQEAITCGQAAVFYDGKRVLGGGWIEKLL